MARRRCDPVCDQRKANSPGSLPSLGFPGSLPVPRQNGPLKQEKQYCSRLRESGFVA